MGLFDKAERAVEKSVNTVFSRMSHAPLKTVDITAELKRSLDRVAPEQPEHPNIHFNAFTVALAEKNFAELTRDTTKEQLELAFLQDLYAYAEEQQYYLLGDLSINLVSSQSTNPGKIVVSPQINRTATSPAFDYSATLNNPIIELNGSLYRLNQDVIILGRSTRADLRLNDNGVSREHLELRITDEGTIATDLNSTNGTFVEDQRITKCHLVDENMVRIGNTTFTFFTPDKGGF